MLDKYINTIQKGDCLEVMKGIPDNSIDSIVTDPPYELGFMGKSWDNTGIANNKEMWAECLRVLKPGGYLLSFGGTRTYHRMAVAIEDAGFEVRDMIEWVYGSGFPKSLNIGKAVDKKGRQSIGWFGQWLRDWREENNITQKEIAKLFPSKTGGLTGCVANWELGLNIPTTEQFNTIVENFDLPFKSIEELEREILGTKSSACFGNEERHTIGASKSVEVDITKGTSEWEGWGTALKPAHEPICMARKPLGQQELDIAKNICYNIIEKGFITNSKIIWRINNVKSAEKQKTKQSSTPTQQQKMVVVSAEFVETKENESVGKKIQKLIENICESTVKKTAKKQTKELQNTTEQIEKEYSNLIKPIKENEKRTQSKNMGVNVSAVEKQTLSSLPLTTLEVEEDSTEKKSKMETSMSSLKSTDTQKTDTDYSAQTATSQWVCMDIVRTLKVSFEGKEYDFIELSDGSLVWNENLEPYRKQQKLNVVENVLKYKTGGINIDESRVEYQNEKDKKEGQSARPSKTSNANEYALNHGGLEGMDRNDRSDITGRFPANLIHDNSEEVRECFPETKSGGGLTKRKNEDAMFDFGQGYEREEISDSGNASRFFKSIIYQAKASKSERNKGCEELEEKVSGHRGNFRCLLCGYQKASGSPCVCPNPEWEEIPLKPQSNNHPTVKPITLMEYLIKMVTPKGGVVLDPFAGSGSTLVAAKQNGYQYIGIELTAEYIPIIEARLKAVEKSNTLF